MSWDPDREKREQELREQLVGQPQDVQTFIDLIIRIEEIEKRLGISNA